MKTKAYIIWRQSPQSHPSKHCSTVVNRAEMVVTVGKINNCVFSLMCVWCQTQWPFFAQQWSASVPVFSDTVCSLEYTLKFVLHKDTIIDFLIWPHIIPECRTPTCSLWFCLNSWVILWLGICFGFPATQRHLFGFACLFRSHFTEHLLVATSHRRQLQSILFHNYCDHPCRMALLEEQLGRINQSWECRAGGIVQWKELCRLP